MILVLIILSGRVTFAFIIRKLFKIYIVNVVYQILTEFTIVVHLLFILFVIAGGFISNKRRWLKVIHLCSLAWAVFAEISPGVMCPLTALENYFAFHAGISTYKEDFITRYLVPVIYQDNVAVNMQYVLVAIVILINVIAYRRLWKGKFA